jgi:hypothetical protein
MRQPLGESVRSLDLFPVLKFNCVEQSQQADGFAGRDELLGRLKRDGSAEGIPRQSIRS